MNWYGIKTLEMLGLIWDVKLPKLGSARVKEIGKDTAPVEAEVAPVAAAAYSGD